MIVAWAAWEAIACAAAEGFLAFLLADAFLVGIVCMRVIDCSSLTSLETLDIV